MLGFVLVMTIHHTSLGVRDFETSVEFYRALFEVLSPSVRAVFKEFPDYKVRFCNFIDVSNGSCLCISDEQYLKPDAPLTIGSPTGHHLCFVATSTAMVDAWYARAIGLGATCNGAPGRRHHYGNYYGAFVTDRNNYRLEACVKDYVADEGL